MPDNHTRRRFIAATGTTSAVALAGCIGGNSKSGTENDSNNGNGGDSPPPDSPEEVEARLALYLDDVLVDYIEEATPNQVTTRCFETIECATEPIEGLSIDRYRGNSPIPLTDYITGHPLNAEFGKSEILNILSDHTPQIDADSHTLVTGLEINGALGVGRTGGKESAVETSIPLFGIAENQTCSNRTLSFEHRFLTYLVHEVGHTLGLNHEYGRVTNMNANEAYVTPMLSRYVYSDEFTETENYFGEWVPDIGDRNVIEVPYFNSDIGVEDTKFG